MPFQLRKVRVHHADVKVVQRLVRLCRALEIRDDVSLRTARFRSTGRTSRISWANLESRREPHDDHIHDRIIGALDSGCRRGEMRRFSTTGVMEERLRFVARLLEGEKMTALCPCFRKA